MTTTMSPFTEKWTMEIGTPVMTSERQQTVETTTSPFNGNWTIASIDNFDPYLATLNPSMGYGAMVSKFMSQVGTAPDISTMFINVDKTTKRAQITSYLKGHEHYDTGFIRLDAETEVTTVTGKLHQITITMPTDKMMLVHMEGTVYQKDRTFTVNGSKLTVTRTNDGITCTEVFEKM